MTYPYKSKSPTYRSSGDSSSISNEFIRIESGFDALSTIQPDYYLFVSDDETCFEYYQSTIDIENTWNARQTFNKSIGFSEYNAGSGSQITISLVDRTQQKITLNEDTEITIDSTGAPAGEYIIRIIQDSTGGWSASFLGIDDSRWIGNHAGVNPDPGKETYVKIYFNGTSMRQRMWWVGKEMT